MIFRLILERAIVAFSFGIAYEKCQKKQPHFLLIFIFEFWWFVINDGFFIHNHFFQVFD